MSCSALSRTSTNTRHLLTICTQKAMRFDKGSCRSRCCGQAGNSLSCPALSRTSLLDSRAKHGNDRGEEKNTGMTEEKKRIRKRRRRRKEHGNDSIIFSSVILRQAQRVPGIFGYSGHTLSVTLRLDVRGKPEHDRKKNKHGNDNIFFLCFTFNIVAFLCDKNKACSINGRQKNL